MARKQFISHSSSPVSAFLGLQFITHHPLYLYEIHNSSIYTHSYISPHTLRVTIYGNRVVVTNEFICRKHLPGTSPQFLAFYFASSFPDQYTMIQSFRHSAGNIALLVRYIVGLFLKLDHFSTPFEDNFFPNRYFYHQKSIFIISQYQKPIPLSNDTYYKTGTPIKSSTNDEKRRGGFVLQS